MGVFFDQDGSTSLLGTILEDAYGSSPPSEDQVEAVVQSRLQSFKPLETAVRSAVTAPAQTPQQAHAKAAASASGVANTLLGGTSFNTGRFLVAMVIFLALLGTAIGCDATNLTSSTTALYSLASSIFGVIVGFLGGEKS